MGRAKLKMELITKEKTRNTTYQKRKHGIIKKANEFTILCDVDTVMIVYPPNSNHPEIWPENPNQINKTIASYKAKKSESGKRTYDLNDFFQDRKKKIEDELVKARKKNMEAKYSTWFEELNGLSEGQLRQFAVGLENKENIVRAHLELKKRSLNMQMPFRFELENNQPGIHYVGPHPSLDQVQGMNMNMNHHLMNHDLGWFNEAPSTSFIPLKREMGGFGYPVFEGGVVYDNSNPWAFQPVVQCGLMPDLALQDSHVMNYDAYDGVGDFVMDDHRGRFMG
ncbi:agamous-like MADS-box protein AGL82 [Cynara cardunculus var. scolymus]|uniref:agamous-like MADS-box protein AGL82 n=1 Tax=Cynara cardunculus var. scolymus TaxID=59895 RepID=UPI000D62CB7A|nr:agamous-like MADS-box protein AGL82 [Cynara cardunculus var. scolymus]